MKRKIALLLTFVALTTPYVSIAETVRIPVGAQATSDSSIVMPSKGMSQKRVEDLFGQPIEKKAPIGQPPITEWVYTEFSVYFEYTHVIHSVRHFKPISATND